jgi:GNAT superfamily N-acetyltransferase
VEDPRLAALEHENLVELLGSLSYLPGARIRRAGGVMLASTGLPLAFFNQAMVADATATDADLADAVAALRDRGIPFVVGLRAGTDDRFVGGLEALGLHRVSEAAWLPGMAVDRDDRGFVAAPDGLAIRVLDGDLSDHEAVASEGFGLDRSIAHALLAGDVPGETYYAGYVDGVPVVSGMGFRTGSTIGVYNIATLPGHRGRGYGAAMTSRVADDGFDAGCDVAVLQSSDMGYSIYERLGYRTVVEYHGFAEPPVEHG